MPLHTRHLNIQPGRDFVGQSRELCHTKLISVMPGECDRGGSGRSRMAVLTWRPWPLWIGSGAVTHGSRPCAAPEALRRNAGAGRYVRNHQITAKRRVLGVPAAEAERLSGGRPGDRRSRTDLCQSNVGFRPSGDTAHCAPLQSLADARRIRALIKHLVQMRETVATSALAEPEGWRLPSKLTKRLVQSQRARAEVPG